MKKSAFILLLFHVCVCLAQKKYPQNVFRNPMDLPIVLAGTFGELRTNHFHAGIDIKTNGRTGQKVYTAMEGYVSRIKVSTSGYGKALYITHPNGYTTVYAHLKKFNDRIEQFIKARQYKKKSYTIQVFPLKTEIPISKNELIAFSGNTGGSSGPHLHFEIRDTRTEKIINPLLFGYQVKDTRNPKVLGVRAYPIDNKAAIDHLPVNQEIQLTKKKPNYFVSKPIKAIGKIGLAIQTHDLQDRAPNKNGVYSIETYVNNQLIYHHRLETFSFDESKYINLLIDYPYYADKRRKYQKTYIEPTNRLSIYKNTPNKGYITIADKGEYTVLIKIKDVAGNTSTVELPIKGDAKINPIIEKEEKTPYYVDRNRETIFKEGNVEIYFPKYGLFKNTYIDFKAKGTHFTVHKPVIPFNYRYTLTYYTDSLPTAIKKYAYIASKDKKGRTNYVSASKKKGKLYAVTKTLGDFTIAYDSIAPKIYNLSFYKNQNISKHKTLKVSIKDNETGIKSYYATIDNQWVLMEYEPKTRRLTFDLNDLKSQNKKHIFQLKIEDLLGNTKTLKMEFIK